MKEQPGGGVGLGVSRFETECPKLQSLRTVIARCGVGRVKERSAKATNCRIARPGVEFARLLRFEEYILVAV